MFILIYIIKLQDDKLYVIVHNLLHKNLSARKDNLFSSLYFGWSIVILQ